MVNLKEPFGSHPERIKRAAIGVLGIGLLLLAADPLPAQVPAAVPLPTQFATAQTAFVVNAGGPDNFLSQIAYKSLCQAFINGKHLQLTARPADAELSLELTTAQGSKTTLTTHQAVLQLNIRDIKTQNLIWSFTEPVDSIANPLPSDFAAAATKLVADFNILQTGKLLNEPPAPKTRFSQESHQQ
ncbi:hypothetical protein [Granulicella sp. dw_53]|uniref:hypothetical protein n=1 Tax=Granulicella sp. dw_53 TaxID=2719792 RepID=UPI001BD34E4E|nr:hypothetical protein [Granulicella sp. dw_53]